MPPKRKKTNPASGTPKSNYVGDKRTRRESNDDTADVEEEDAARHAQKEKAMRAFKLFDEVGKGCVVLEDLQRISNDLGEGFTEDELEEMLVFADKKGDGLLQPKDFVRIARQINL